VALIYLTDSQWAEYGHQVEAIEALAEYPIGNDFFRISHGKDYFSFFRRLGFLRYCAWVERGRVAAVAAAILRKLPGRGGALGKAWYLCDLKVHPDFRGERIPLRMLGRAFLPNYLRCAHGYAISMDPADRPNRIAPLLAHFRWASLRAAGKLLLWSLDQKTVLKNLPLVQKHRGPVSFLSLHGKKDIILKSTGLPMSLYHLQFGPLAEQGLGEPPADSVNMFCAPDGDALAKELIAAGLHPSSTATIISHRMQTDWKWVLTSDI